MKQYRQWEMRLYVAFFLIAVEVFFLPISAYMKAHGADFYFLVCGGGNLIVIACLPIARGTNFIADLQKFHFAELLVQYTGWVLYECSFEPVAYNSMILALTIAQVLRLVWVNDDNNTAAHFDWGYFFSFDRSSLGKNYKGAV